MAASSHQMQSMEEKSAGKSRSLVGFIILSIFQIFPLSHTHDMNCSVTQGGRHTLYAVPRTEAEGCFYSWFNKTGHVLANHEGQMDELVEMNTINSLRTTECIPIVQYKQDCLSEESLREAHCNTSCTEHTNPEREEGNTRHHWTPAAAIPAVLLLFCGLFLLCIFRKRLCRHEAADSSVV